MFSKNKPKERIDTEQREQFEYARKRINQKKRLMRHFIVFLAGSILLIIINPVLGIGKDFFIQELVCLGHPDLGIAISYPCFQRIHLKQVYG